VPPKKEPELEGPVPDEATLYDKVKSKFRKPRLTRKQALSARPIRNPALKWEELDGGEIRIVLPRRDDRVGKVLSVLFYVPKSRPINLDIVGANVWKRCDGQHTVDDIVDALVEEHRLHRREAEVSLTEFLKMLGKRNMVAFLVPNDVLRSEKAGDQPAPEAEQPPPPKRQGSAKQAPSKRTKGRKRDDR